MLALSTAWYPKGRPGLAATLEAIARMGFQAVELGVTDSAPVRPKEAEKALAEAGLKVVSIHNVCSARKLDPTNRRGDWLGSADEGQRRGGVEATAETIESARALGARAVVLHIGSLPIPEKWEKQALLAALARGRANAAVELGVSREEILAERTALAPAHLEAAARSLEELLDKSAGVQLGIECRLGWHELPNFDELRVLLARFPDPRLGYWHDVGHAAILDWLGVVPEDEWLLGAGARTIGAHLHDVRGNDRDHYPPGLGELDFAPLLGQLPPDALRVMEISANFIEEEVALGKRRLEELGF